MLSSEQTSKHFVVVNPNGVILRSGYASENDLEIQASGPEEIVLADSLTLPEDQRVAIDGLLDDSTVYWDGSAFVPYPVPSPGPWFAWDGVAWVDMRPEGSEEDALRNRRANTSLPKLEFVMRIVGAQIISQASGLKMLDGQMPDEMEGMLEGMPPSDQFEVAAKLKGAVTIERLDPFIIAAGQFLGLTDQQVDAVFGIV